MLSTGWSIKDIKLFESHEVWIFVRCRSRLWFHRDQLAGEHVSRLFFSLFMDESRVLAMLSQENAGDRWIVV